MSWLPIYKKHNIDPYYSLYEWPCYFGGMNGDFYARCDKLAVYTPFLQCGYGDWSMDILVQPNKDNLTVEEISNKLYKGCRKICADMTEDLQSLEKLSEECKQDAKRVLELSLPNYNLACFEDMSVLLGEDPNDFEDNDKMQFDHLLLWKKSFIETRKDGFWTLFVPEKITQFKDVKVISNDGNEVYILCLSEKNMYFFCYGTS